MLRDFGKYLGSAIMLGFGVIAFYRWHQSQLLFFLLLTLRDLVAAYFFLKRADAEIKSSRFISVISYVSSAMPLLYFGPSVFDSTIILCSNLLAITGFFLVTLATIELGTSIGISPAKRPLVTSGVYKWIKHPMYIGYGISELGMALINPWNMGLLIFSGFLYLIRSKMEGRIFSFHNVCK